MSTSLTHQQPPVRAEKQQAMRTLIRSIARQLVSEAQREQREAPANPTSTRQSRKGK